MIDTNAKPKKPFYKKWWFYLIVILIALTIFGWVSTAKEKPITVPDVAGMTATQADTTLKTAGFNTITYETQDGERVKPSDKWDATKTIPAAGDTLKPSSELVVVVNDDRVQAEKEAEEEARQAEKESEQAAKQAEEESRQAERDAKKAEKERQRHEDWIKSYGWTLCETEAESQLGLKVEVDRAFGILNEEVTDGDTVHLKGYATVTNAAGAEKRISLECTIRDPEGDAEFTHFHISDAR